MTLLKNNIVCVTVVHNLNLIIFHLLLISMEDYFDHYTFTAICKILYFFTAGRV